MKSPAPNIADNDDRFCDLLAEYLRRVDAGEAVDQGAFMAAHPDYAEALAEYFEGASAVEQMAGPRVDALETMHRQADAETSADGLWRASMTNAKRGVEVGSRASASSGEIPETFGRYTILKALGQGAMGAVYLAQDTQLERQVALKIPKFSGEESADMLQRFYREARAAAKLRHPHICPVHDVGQIDGQHYITMAFIEGRPLRDFVRSKKLQPERQVAVIIRKLALGLAEAHAHGVIHRDLKPANIMVDTKGEPVVMDFGLARREEGNDRHVTRSGAILGTPAYMSPEQVEGDQSKIGPPADIYSLGVVMYELLTGRVPFNGSLMSILMQIASEQPKPPSVHRPELDSRLEAICLKMMAKKSSHRYPSMNDVAKSLGEYLKTPPSENSVGNALRAVPGESLDSAQQSAASSKSRSLPVAGRLDEEPVENIPSQFTFSPVTSPLPQPTRSASEKSQPAPSVSDQLLERARSVPPKAWVAIGAGLAGVAMLLAAVTFYVRLGKIDVKVVLKDESFVVKFDKETITFEGQGAPIRLKPGAHTFSIERDGKKQKFIVERDGLEVETDEFSVKKNGQNVLEVSLLEGKIVVAKNGESHLLARRESDEVARDGTPNEDARLAATSLADEELLKNPGCEESLVDGKIPGWVESKGRWGQGGLRGKLSPFEGKSFFNTGKSARAELYQDVSVDRLASAVDTGQQQFKFAGWVRSFDQDKPDITRVLIEFRDATNGVVLAQHDFGLAKNVKFWKPLLGTRPAPVGTRWIRVRLISLRTHAESNDGYFDGLSLRAVAQTPASTDPTLPKIDWNTGERAPDLSRLKPTFETDFDGQVKGLQGFGGGLSSAGYEPGYFFVERNKDAKTAIAAVGELEDYTVKDFACEARVRFMADVAQCFELRFADPAAKLSLWWKEPQVLVNEQKGDAALVKPRGEYNTLLLVIRNGQATGYLNGKRIRPATPLVGDLQPTDKIRFIAGGAGGARIEIDRVTLWDLSQDAATFDKTSAGPAIAPPPAIAPFDAKQAKAH